MQSGDTARSFATNEHVSSVFDDIAGEESCPLYSFAVKRSFVVISLLRLIIFRKFNFDKKLVRLVYQRNPAGPIQKSSSR